MMSMNAYYFYDNGKAYHIGKFLFLNYSYSALKVSKAMTHPENYGVVYDVEHYNKLIKKNNYIEVSKRGKNFVSYCKEEMAENKSCRDETVLDPCDGVKTISSGIFKKASHFEYISPAPSKGSKIQWPTSPYYAIAPTNLNNGL